MVNSLGEELACYIFKKKSGTTVYEIVDEIKREFMEYQTEQIPSDFNRKEDGSTNDSNKMIRPSYWREAYIIAGVEVEACDPYLLRIDEYWINVLTRLIDSNTTTPKYDTLFTFVMGVLLLSHGNSEPKRGFSVNKFLIDIHGSSGRTLLEPYVW